MTTDDGKPEIIAATFDGIEAMMDTYGDNAAALVMELGGRGHFWAADVVRASEALLAAIARLGAEQTLVLTIGGYDDDPRELYQVPDVIQFLRRVMKHAGITHWSHPAVRMLNEESLALLLQCGVFGKDHPWRVRQTEGRDPNTMLRRHP